MIRHLNSFVFSKFLKIPKEGGQLPTYNLLIDFNGIKYKLTIILFHMPRCPNCNYLLVLLEHRRKYKCAKCSKLFSQREIDDAEFRGWNKKRRKEEKENVEKELQEIIKVESKKLTKEEMHEKKIALQRIWREKNREAYNQYKREYWAKHRERLLEKRKENYEKRKPEILEKQRLYRQNNKEKNRLKHLRDTQKKLAERKFESAKQNGSVAQILIFLLTFLLSELL